MNISRLSSLLWVVCMAFVASTCWYTICSPGAVRLTKKEQEERLERIRAAQKKEFEKKRGAGPAEFGEPLARSEGHPPSLAAPAAATPPPPPTPLSPAPSTTRTTTTLTQKQLDAIANELVRHDPTLFAIVPFEKAAPTTEKKLTQQQQQQNEQLIINAIRELQRQDSQILITPTTIFTPNQIELISEIIQKQTTTGGKEKVKEEEKIEEAVVAQDSQQDIAAAEQALTDYENVVKDMKNPKFGWGEKDVTDRLRRLKAIEEGVTIAVAEADKELEKIAKRLTTNIPPLHETAQKAVDKLKETKNKQPLETRLKAAEKLQAEYAVNTLSAAPQNAFGFFKELLLFVETSVARLNEQEQAKARQSIDASQATFNRIKKEQEDKEKEAKKKVALKNLNAKVTEFVNAALGTPRLFGRNNDADLKKAAALQSQVQSLIDAAKAAGATQDEIKNLTTGNKDYNAAVAAVKAAEEAKKKAAERAEQKEPSTTGVGAQPLPPLQGLPQSSSSYISSSSSSPTPPPSLNIPAPEPYRPPTPLHPPAVTPEPSPLHPPALTPEPSPLDTPGPKPEEKTAVGDVEQARAELKNLLPGHNEAIDALNKGTTNNALSTFLANVEIDQKDETTQKQAADYLSKLIPSKKSNAILNMIKAMKVD